jgi:iron complex outermembrane recepter protein
LNSLKIKRLAIPLSISLLLPCPLLADESNAGEREYTSVLEEVIVTSARRREEAIQSTPVAVTGLNARLIEKARVYSTADLGKIAPSLQTFSQVSASDTAGIYLRGFGVSTDDLSTDPPVAIYIDGSYQPHVVGSMIDFFDVEKVEVLRGPQGTLFGKNAPSGAINITTKRPTGELGGAVQVDVGRFDKREIRGRFDFPIIEDVLAGKIFLVDKSGGDFIRNTNLNKDIGGTDLRAARASLLFTPNDSFDWFLTLFHSQDDSEQPGIRDATTTFTDPLFHPDGQVNCTVFGNCTPQRKYTTQGALPERQDIELFDVSSEMNLRLSPVNLTSVTTGRKYDNTNHQDADAYPYPLVEARYQNQQYDTFSQELRIASEPGGWDMNGRMDWVAGVYYFKEDFELYQPLVIFGGPLLNLQEGETESKAVYSQATFHLSDSWDFTFGARRTWDEKDHAYNIVTTDLIHESGKWSNTSFEGTLQYTLDDNKMGYLPVAEGYRGGGFVGSPPSPAFAGAYDPETVISYEVGAKLDWLDKRLRTNIALYRSEYEDLQRSIAKTTDVAPFYALTTQNAAEGVVQGLELETTFVPIDALTLKLNLSYIDAEYTEFFGDATGFGVERDNSDFEWGYVPKWSGLASAEYVVFSDIGSFNFGVDYTYRDSMYAYDLPSPLAEAPSLGLLDASIAFTTLDEKYTVSLYGTNLTNEYYSNSISAFASLYTVLHDSPPRQWGVSLKVDF